MAKIKKNIQYPLEWLGIQLYMGLFGMMPLRVASAIGGKLGELGRLVLKKRQKITADNIRAAIPECDTPEFYKRLWNNWGRAEIESLHLKKYARNIGKLVLIKNQELFDRANSFDRLLVCHMHYGLMGLYTLPFCNNARFNIVYKQPHNPLSDKLLRRIFGTAARNSHFIAASDSRAMMGAFLNNEKMAVAADLKYNGVIANFFGRPAKTPIGALKLADKFGCPILMMYDRRIGGIRHELVAEELIMPADTDKRNMQYINDVIERIIRRDPSQWLWQHRRW
ncbi:MAG: lysophospholipid acyltransferase family protein [Rickettsiales bacterium]|jgi:KDO2-lipid IV(A) lauroyltransferase|nr:lysophospholipid acyltransferase family protein [Rickettsiales bacterium]